MATVREQLQRQIASNIRSLPYYDSFREHRTRQTAWALPTGPQPNGSAKPPEAEGPPRTLCVLGAGNCFDLDLELLAEHYDGIHLVDLDEDALRRARERESEATRSRLVLHAPVDLSGCNDALERWRDLKASPDELMAIPSRVPQALLKRLSGEFHTVLSACLLSQLLLTVRRVLGAEHPLFEAATLVQTLTHLRSLVRLTRSGGRALLVTDVTSNEIAELPTVEPGTDQRPLLARLHRDGQLFHATAPARIAELVREDPGLGQLATLSDPLDAWTWQVGSERNFLVTAQCLLRR